MKLFHILNNINWPLNHGWLANDTHTWRQYRHGWSHHHWKWQDLLDISMIDTHTHTHTLDKREIKIFHWKKEKFTCRDDNQIDWSPWSPTARDDARWWLSSSFGRKKKNSLPKMNNFNENFLIFFLLSNSFIY